MSRNRTDTFIHVALSTQILDQTFWYAPRMMNLGFFQSRGLEKMFTNIFSKLLGFNFKNCKLVCFHTHWEFFFDIFTLNLNNKLKKLYKRNYSVLYTTCYVYKHKSHIYKLLDCFYYNHLITCDFKYKYKQINLLQGKLKKNLGLKYCFNPVVFKNILKNNYIKYTYWLSQSLKAICRFIQAVLEYTSFPVSITVLDWFYFCCEILFKRCLCLAGVSKNIKQVDKIKNIIKLRPAGVVPSALVSQLIMKNVLDSPFYAFGIIKRLFWFKRQILLEFRFEMIKRLKILILIYQFYLFYLFKVSTERVKTQSIHINFISILLTLVFKKQLKISKNVNIGQIVKSNDNIITLPSTIHNFLIFKKYYLSLRLRKRFRALFRPKTRKHWINAFNIFTKKALKEGPQSFTFQIKCNILVLTSLLFFFCKLNNFKTLNKAGLQYLFFNYMLLYFSNWTYLIPFRKISTVIHTKARVQYFSYKFISSVLFFNFFYKKNYFIQKFTRKYALNFMQKNLMSIQNVKSRLMFNFRVARYILINYQQVFPKKQPVKSRFFFQRELNGINFFSTFKFDRVISKFVDKFFLNIKCNQKLAVISYVDFKSQLYAFIQKNANDTKFSLIFDFCNIENYTFDVYTYFLKKYVYFLNLNFLKYLCYFYSFYFLFPMTTCSVYLAYQQLDLQLFTTFLNYVYNDSNKINFLYFKVNFLKYFFTPYLGFYLLVYKFLCISSTFSCDLIIDFIFYSLCKIIKGKQFYRSKRLLYAFSKIFNDFISSQNSDLIGVHLSLKGRLRKTTQRKQKIRYNVGKLHFTTLLYKVFTKKRYICSSIGISTVKIYFCFKGKLPQSTKLVL